jgi:hypothetical protein
LIKDIQNGVVCGNKKLMDKHCKNCVHHHNAGHLENSNKAFKYNDWCCRLGCKASGIIGHCKMKDLKKTLDKEDNYGNS